MKDKRKNWIGYKENKNMKRNLKIKDRRTDNV